MGAPLRGIASRAARLIVFEVPIVPSSARIIVWGARNHPPALPSGRAGTAVKVFFAHHPGRAARLIVPAGEHRAVLCRIIVWRRQQPPAWRPCRPGGQALHEGVPLRGIAQAELPFLIVPAGEHTHENEESLV